MNFIIYNQTIGSVFFFILSLYTLHLTLGHGDRNEEQKISRLIIVSLDGFRWDYLSRINTPNFHRIINNGVHARYGMKASFVTKTLPNHFTLATGWYEESHGIVANEMFDPVLNEVFSTANSSQISDPRWFDMGAEPIWVTNQVQKLGRSGCMQWVGCAAPIKGILPTRFVPYDENMPFKTRVDETINWFVGPPYPINLGLIYFHEPDKTGHIFGPDSQEVTDKIAQLDGDVGYLLEQLEKADMLDDINLIITSDHGFARTPKNLVINLDKYIHSDTYRIFSVSPIASILPNEGKEESIYLALSAAAEAEKTFRVYKNNTIPEQYHYRQNRRIMPILVEANENYTIVYNNNSDVLAGNHGYNNSLQDMHPFFIAMGPDFKRGAEVATFNNVDVYALMCHLLGLKPAPNNGSLNALLSLLAEDEEQEKTTVITFGTYFFVLIVLGTVGGIFAVAACRQHRYLKRQQRSHVISMEGGIKYSMPPVNGGAKVPLLSDTSEEESFR